MTKKAGHFSKKRLFLIAGSTLVGLVVIGLGLWYFLGQRAQQKAADTTRQTAIETQRKQLDEAAFRGDKDIAAKYLERIKSGDSDGALKMYEQAAASLDQDGKITLYQGAVSAAAQAKQEEHRLKFLLTLAELKPHYLTYGAIADIYAARHDATQQAEYLRKALEQVEMLDHSLSGYATLRDAYQQQLDGVQQ